MSEQTAPITVYSLACMPPLVIYFERLRLQVRDFCENLFLFKQVI